MTLSDGIGFMLSAVNHFLIIVITAVMCWKCIALKLEKTAFHAFACTLGFVCLAAEGVMMRYSRNFMFYSFSTELKHTLHYTLLLVGGTLGIIGTVQKMWGKKQHFTTQHGKYGIAACVFCAINIILGAIVYWSHAPPRLLQLLHNVVGLLSVVTAFVAQYLGYFTGFFKRNFDNAPKFKSVTVIILMLTVAGPLQTFVRKIIL